MQRFRGLELDLGGKWEVRSEEGGCATRGRRGLGIVESGEHRMSVLKEKMDSL